MALSDWSARLLAPPSYTPARATPIELLVVIALCAVAFWNTAYFMPYTVDDTFVALRYAWNAAHGNGLVFNPGERVEGYSNPSLTLLATGAIAAGFDALTFVKRFGVVCTTLLPLATWLAGRAYGLDRGYALIAPLLVATSLELAYWGPIGLETPLWTLALVTFFGLWARRLYGRETGVPWSALAGAGLYLTRPEAPLFLLPAIGAEAWLLRADPSRRTAAITWVVALAVPCLAWLGFRFFYYDDLLANTYYVKATNAIVLKPSIRYLKSFFVVSAPITGALFLLLAWPAARARLGLWPLVGVLVQALVIVRANSDWMPQHRFWAHVVPLYALVIAIGARNLGELLSVRMPASVIPALTTIAVLAQGVFHLGYDRHQIDGEADLALKRYAIGAKTWQGRLEMPFWTGVPDKVLQVLLHVPEGASVAHSEAGLLGFVTDSRVVDGLASFDRRLSGATGEDLDEVIASYGDKAPDVILLRPGVPILMRMQKAPWYTDKGYAERHTWQHISVVSPLALEPLSAADALPRLERATERVPRDTTFLKARIDTARALGDPARYASACAHADRWHPKMQMCGAAPTTTVLAAPAAVTTLPAVFPAVQTVNGSFTTLAGDKPADWDSIPPSAPGWAVVEGALAIDQPILVCTMWFPVNGPIQVRGKVKTEGVAAGVNPNQTASVSLRVKNAGGGQEFPLLKTWTGTADWADFSVGAVVTPGSTEYRVCVGFYNGGSGKTSWDDIEAGSG